MQVKAIRVLAALATWLVISPLSVSAQEVIFIVRHSDPPTALSFDEIQDETPLSESGNSGPRCWRSD